MRRPALDARRNGPAAARLGLCVGVALAIGLGMLVLFGLLGFSWEPALHDVAATAGVPFWHGAGPVVTVMLWAAMAGACLLTASVLAAAGGREEAIFFATSAALLAFLGLDDALQLHENAFPYKLGVPQALVYLGYGVAAALYVLRFRERLLASDLILLAGWVLPLALSVGIDAVSGGGAFEEYCKLVGVSLGACYWLLECRRALVPGAELAGD
jgi:hypothetical protein